jgi:hypothetical protein
MILGSQAPNQQGKRPAVAKVGTTSNRKSIIAAKKMAMPIPCMVERRWKVIEVGIAMNASRMQEKILAMRTCHSVSRIREVFVSVVLLFNNSLIAGVP